MKSIRSRTILCFQKPSRPARRETLSGILSAAQAQHLDVIVLPDVKSANEIRALIARHAPLGCISNRNFADDFVDGNIFEDTPTVFFGSFPLSRPPKTLLVRDNATAIANMAFRELLSLAPASYAYVGDASGAEWSRRRGDAFVRAVKTVGKGCSILNIKSLRRELTTVTRPCGVFAANDMTASAIYAASQQLQLNIPDDLAIISVDNDDLICENMTPTLSSIQMDLAECGRLAVEWLAHPDRRKIREYGPIAPVLRGSTSHARSPGPLVQRALAIISRNACSPGFSVTDVAAQLGFSRRYLDRIFREQFHQTVLEAIHDIRFARLLTLLCKGDIPLSSIAASIGFGTQIALQKFFQKRMGMSMRKWRSQHGIAGIR